MVTEAPEVTAVAPDVPPADTPPAEAPPEVPPSPLAGLDDAALDALPEVMARLERVRADAKRENEEAVAAAQRDTKAKEGERYQRGLSEWVQQGKYTDDVNALVKRALDTGEDISRAQLDQIVGGLRVDTGNRYDEAFHEFMTNGLPKDYRIPASTQKGIDDARKALARNEDGARIKLWTAIQDAGTEARTEQATATMRAEIEKEVRAELETRRLKEAEAARLRAGSPARTSGSSPTGGYDLSTLTGLSAAKRAGYFATDADAAVAYRKVMNGD